ncbi:MAG TPA: M20/M25/M40 family metallo-hydrolase [Candidatus Udaeobacter sp.]|nr:M20/M25/M40 family metallo-hydrolase [Candidatus Udaeobacter sp.]
MYAPHPASRPVARRLPAVRLALLGLALTCAFAAPRPAAANDPTIQGLVDQVTQARLAQIVQRLQNFGTRYSRSDSVHRAADYLIGQFQSFGYPNDDIFQHPFVVTISGQPYPQRNIVCIKPGTTRPDEIYVIGGHYDSTSNQALTAAPGADDDGSGTAAVIAMAEILADVPLDATVMFATWGAEEQGFVGSQAWVTYALGEGYDIQLYMNIDACGYQGDPDNIVKLFSNALSMPFNTTMQNLCTKYTNLVPVIVTPIPFSDHVPFQNAGFPFTYSIEEDITPFIHTPNDLLSTIDMAYFQKIVQTNLAALVTFAGITPTTGVADPELVAAANPLLRLTGANPITGPARLELTLPSAMNAQLSIYDVLGHRLATLLEGPQPAGRMPLEWAGRSAAGQPVAAGVYFARLDAAGKAPETIRLVVTP